jgi:23S rRNA (guanosine2251-2'-O)-methyltransferase
MAGIELIYGRNAVREMLRAGRRRVHRVLIAEGAQDGGALSEIITLAGQAGAAVKTVERGSLERMAGGANHHGVVAEASSYPYAAFSDLLGRLRAGAQPALVLILDYIQDPQNLGTLVRTAEALSVHGIIIPEHRAAGVTPAVVNASAGATEHMAIAVAPNLVRAMKELQGTGLWLVGLEKVEGAPLYVDVDLTRPLGLVVGGEGRGMSRLVRQTCDYIMQLPMSGKVNSLNAAVAGSVALYEIWRQRARLAP